MYYEELQDLMLSGVKWEINENPNAPEYKNQSIPDTQHGNGATIVPAIAPTKEVPLSTAVSMAARPNDLESLCRMIGEFNHPLKRGATNVVLPHIAPNPNGVMILTDMPGAEDDATGIILSGPAGDMIDKMLNAVDMSRDSVSVVPMLFWRTPGGRTPTDTEIDLAKPFVERLIEMINPKIILTLGTLPAATFGGVQLASKMGIPVDTTYGAKIVPIYHPNFLALKPSAKRDVWNVLQNLQNLLKTVQK